MSNIAPKIVLSQTLGPNGMFMENWCETEFKIHKVDYVWVIHNYNICKANTKRGESLKSPVFSGAANKACKWHLKLHPNGFDIADNNSITDDSAIYLILDETSNCESAMAELKFSILNENQKEVKVSQNGIMRNYTKKKGGGWGYEDFIKSDYVLPSDDKLAIYCEIKCLVSDHTTNSLDKSISATVDFDVPELRLSSDFGQLFNDEESSDVVISVNRKNFKAHKLILSTRSPVFAAMFRHENMKENREKKVVIADFDEQVVEEMLKYIYTGETTNLNKSAAKLLMIAEKYQLEGLKDMSARALVRNLSAKNATNALLFADYHEFQKLKSVVIEFIAKNSVQVMKTTPWKRIVVSHPQLIVEVCEALP